MAHTDDDATTLKHLGIVVGALVGVMFLLIMVANMF